MLQRLEIRYTNWIRREPKGLLAGLMKACLYVLSWGFHLASSVRNWLFDQGWLRQYSPPVSVVISVGNITSGGTGKTPVTQMIAGEFNNDHQVAILSRGYRSKAEKMQKPCVLSRGEGPLLPASHCGDEPYLLAKNLPKVYVYVGKDRHKAANLAAQDGAEIILLDDGMQHRFLARDFDVVVIDAGDPFGKGFFVPRGFLREHLKALSRAHLIVVNHAENDNRFQSIVKQVEQYSKAPVVRTEVEVEKVWTLNGDEVDSLAGKKVAAFCGIANPEYFYETVAKLGCDIVLTKSVSDHLSFSKEQLEKLCKKAQALGAEMLICTEKDRVKISENFELSLPVVWVKMRLRLIEGGALWKNFINHVKSVLNHGS